MAGEGSFLVTRKSPPFADGDPRLRFVFTVTMASRDQPLLELLAAFIGAGKVAHAAPRKSGWQPTSTYSVGSIRAHRNAVIPFAESFLLPGAKRLQFEQWRIALDSYESFHPTRWGNGRSRCSEPDCDGLVRGRGLCRKHYYRATGH